MQKIVLRQFALSKGNWIRVMDMTNWQLSTPEANKVISDYIRWEYTQNCLLRCFYYHSNAQKELIGKKYHRRAQLLFIRLPQPLNSIRG